MKAVIATVAGVALLLLAPSFTYAQTTSRIAIIIDDVGYRLDADKRVMQLPREVAVAVLPHSPHGERMAEQAATQQRQVLLHLPLQSLNDKSDSAMLGPGAISLDTTRGEFSQAFAENLAAVPHASGVNNHMGSLLTRHPGHMRWLMEEIACHANLYFVDSRTTHHSVAFDAALSGGVAATQRDVFLDRVETDEAIRLQFERLLHLARVRGQALAIGHPHPATLAVLEELLPTLAAAGFELVAPDALLQTEVEVGSDNIAALSTP